MIGWKGYTDYSELMLESHWDIYFNLVELQGYDGKRLCIKCGRIERWIPRGCEMVIRCSNCKYPYCPTASTIFANSKMFLTTWLIAIHILKCINPNITLIELCKQLDCTNVTACNIRRKIKLINQKSIEHRLYKMNKHKIIKSFFKDKNCVFYNT